jgi:tRNA threonylcarbamoyladenosine biosynthesis protein TsaB
MKTLLIETSSEHNVIAFADDTTILFSTTMPSGYNNSQTLLPAIEEGLQHSGLSLSDLDTITIGAGPGSYTGIRVGASIAQGLAYSLNIPLIAISSLKTFAPTSDGTFACVIDAKISGAYTITGEHHNGATTYTSEPSICPLKDLPSLLSSVNNIICPASKRLQRELSLLSPENTYHWEERPPSAEHMVNLAAETFKRKGFVAADELELHYLRKTQAELEQEKAKIDLTDNSQ